MGRFRLSALQGMIRAWSDLSFAGPTHLVHFHPGFAGSLGEIWALFQAARTFSDDPSVCANLGKPGASLLNRRMLCSQRARGPPEGFGGGWEFGRKMPELERDRTRLHCSSVPLTSYLSVR